MAEVVGLALGVVPLVLEALKQYGRLYRACKKFKRCKNGIEELLNCLQTQKVIFANETRLLLTNALGSENAIAMVNDVDHSLWHDTKIQSRVEVFLGDAGEVFIMTSQDISRTMKRLEDELEKLRFEDRPVYGLLEKEWRKEVRKRFTYVFSESKLLDIASSISNLTRHYRTLRLQIEELAVIKPDPERGTDTVQATPERLMTTQAAAKRVYEVLAVACKLHTKHHAHLSLSPQYNSSPAGTEIKFQLAYRHLSRQQSHNTNDAFWFIIESVLFATVTTIPPTIAVGISPSKPAKRSRSPSLVVLRKAAEEHKKRVRFRSPSPEAVPICSSPTAATLTAPLLPDLGTTADFCTQLRACCRDDHLSGTCIGWLKSSSQWKHRVYPSKGPREQAVQKEAAPLSALLDSVKQSQPAYQRLPLLQRLQLAKVLVTATLNFFATPWMQSCWSSDDIFLYDVESAQSSASLKEPDVYIEVPVDEQLGMTNHQTAQALTPFVRNPVLFNLAVMLLELALEKPLRDMIQPSDAKPGLPASTIEYYAAVRLSKEVSAFLGPQYSHIVEQCLFCAFGHGTELSSPALQSAIHKEVVSELDRLANGFRKLLVI